MKTKSTLLIIFAVLSAFVCFGQPANFSLDENNYVTWSKEYNSNLSKEDLQEVLLRHPIFHYTAQNLYGFTENVVPSCDIKTFPIYAHYMYNFLYFIDFTTTGYKITVKNFKFLNQNTQANYNISVMEDLVLNKAKTGFLDDSKSQIAYDCFNNTLVELFDFKD